MNTEWTDSDGVSQRFFIPRRQHKSISSALWSGADKKKQNTMQKTKSLYAAWSKITLQPT